MKNIKEQLTASKYFYSCLALLMVITVSGILSPSFFRIGNLLTILRQSSVLLVLSTGLTAVVLTGGIDLSVGSVAGLVGCICAKLMTGGWSVGKAVLAGLLCAALIGLFNGFLVGVLKLPAFIATYGTNWVLSGIATIIMQGQVIYGLPADFTKIGTGYVGAVAIPIVIAALGVVLFWALLQKTTFGRNIYMLGANPEAARYSGTNILLLTFMAYMLSSLMGGLGGVIQSARLNAADVSMCNSYGLQIVAAVVIGGTSLMGGEGGVCGTVIGAVILMMIVNVMNLVGLSSHLQGMAVGAVILLMVFIDIYSRERNRGVQKRNRRNAGHEKLHH